MPTASVNRHPTNADDVFNAAVAIAREVVDERSLGTRLSEIQQRAMREHVPTHRDASFSDIIEGQRKAMDQAASEFVAPYLRRIAELEAENKALRDAILNGQLHVVPEHAEYIRGLLRGAK